MDSATLARPGDSVNRDILIGLGVKPPRFEIRRGEVLGSLDFEYAVAWEHTQQAAARAAQRRQAVTGTPHRIIDHGVEA